jgi:hypothetical protein
MSELQGEWPEGLDVLVLPGIPGKDVKVGTGELPYPTTTTDVIKVIRERGLKIDYHTPDAKHVWVGYKAGDWWGPIMVIAEGTVGSLIAAAIWELVGAARAKKLRIHLKVGKATKGGTTVKWFEAHGPAGEVVEAMRQFFHDGDD